MNGGIAMDFHDWCGLDYDPKIFQHLTAWWIAAILAKLQSHNFRQKSNRFLQSALFGTATSQQRLSGSIFVSKLRNLTCWHVDDLNTSC